MALLGKRGKRKGGRRRNYEPASTGGRSLPSINFGPVGWVNWTGFILFGRLSIALVAETATTISEGAGADSIAAGVMTVACGWMSYLFATTPFRDEEELGEAFAARGKSSRD